MVYIYIHVRRKIENWDLPAIGEKTFSNRGFEEAIAPAKRKNVTLEPWDGAPPGAPRGRFRRTKRSHRKMVEFMGNLEMITGYSMGSHSRHHR